MKKFFSLFLKISLSIILVFLVVKFTNLNIPKTIEQLKKTNLYWFGLTTLMFTLTVFTNNYRWILLAKLLNYHITFKHGLRMYFEGAFSNNFLPTNFGGDALRAYDLSRRDGNFVRAGSTVVMERLFGFAMMFGMIPIGILMNKLSPDKVFFPQHFEMIMLITFFTMVIGISTCKLWTKIPLKVFGKVEYAIDEYTKCHKSLAKVILWTFITHMIFLAGNVCSAYAMGVTLKELPFWYWLLITPASTLAGFIIPTVKGVGAKEASYIYFLGLVGINTETSLAIAFLSFLATTISTLPGVTIAFRRFTKKIKCPPEAVVCPVEV